MRSGADIIIDLWKAGGVSLLLIGLAGLNLLFVPNFGDYNDTKQIITTGGLILAGLVTWGTLAVLNYKTWNYKMQVLTQQDAKVLDAALRLLESDKDTAVGENRIKVLTNTLPALKAASAQPPRIAGDAQNSPPET